jgi:YVTN family beta-propeller protein
MALTPDGNHLIVTNNGTGAQSLTVIETSGWKVLQTLPVSKSWLGMRLARDGKTLYLSGGNDNRVLVYAFEAGTLTLEDSIRLGSPRPQQKIWTGGMDLDEGSGRLYVVGRESDSIYAVSLASRAVVRRAALPARPYTCLLAGKVLYVTLWGGSAVAMLDPETLALTGTITVGDHPCDIIAHPRDGRLFVANANHNTVSVIDPARGKVIETITTSLTPTAPAGSTPNALALDARRGRLFVANADNNYLAVFDVEQPGRSRAVGFIPTGWYPTAVRYEARSNTILVANGKGSGSRANPGGPNPTVRNAAEEYIGSMFAGTVSAIPDPGDSILAHHTLQVYQNSPCTDARRDRGARPADNPVPGGRGGGERSPIRHVFYIIKENRTYDQVFGDMSEGNGDPSLCLFPDSVTPNHHALAREFVLLDNFYCDAEVSADGHNWSMGAYATDYVEKSWPTMYGGRGGEYDFQGGAPIAAPSGGYLWDNCRRHGVTYRSYGEWADNPARPGDSAKALAPALVGHVAPFYIGWDMSFSDVDRAKLWMAEFDEFERNGNLPQFQVITLPNDHTEGTRRGSLTPQAYVAQNDLALGMIVERISRSRYWKESAIFVVEDDAQNGPDHVDAHRTVALVISPWTKRRVVDSELYSTTSMVRTMELILGLPPMSQFDAASTPMYGSFSSTADLTPYRCRPARIDITRRNPAGAYGQERSGELDFSKEDRVPDVEFSEIIWKAVRGADSPMPPPVRSAFVRVLEEDEE